MWPKALFHGVRLLFELYPILWTGEALILPYYQAFILLYYIVFTFGCAQF
jgi:hypothetical protein